MFLYNIERFLSVTSINPICNTNYNLPIKSTQQSVPVTSSVVPVPKVSFKGTEALAAYNYNLVNKSNFNIPELKPICPLENMDKIKGKRIYNSDGTLVCIVDKNNDYKTVYTPSSDNNNIYDVEVFKNNQLIKQQVFYKSVDNNIYLGIYNYNDNCRTLYKYDNGNLSLYSKEKQDSQNAYVFWAEKQEYECYDGNIKKLYDKNLNLKQTIDFTKENQNVRTNYWNDKAVSKETRVYKNESIADDGINPFEDKDLIPAKYYEIGTTDNIQGKRYYYSNGQLEKIVTPENKAYCYDLDGNFECLKFDNKKISLLGTNSIVIEEKLGNNISKITYFDEKQPTCVKYFNDNQDKLISWDKDGIITYQQCDDGYSVLQKSYDKDMKLINQRVWYHDDQQY